MQLTGKIVGYDPGGNDHHGVAALYVDHGKSVRLSFGTVRNAEAAVRWFLKDEPPIAAGVDTLTALSTGDSGWRPADWWLRKQYKEVRNSVQNPNALRGSMSLNGLAVISRLRLVKQDLLVSETHPKVLYFHMSGERHDYEKHREVMDSQLSQWLGLPVKTGNDHEWDAAISCFAILEGPSGRWPGDLHQLPVAPNEALVQLVGPSHYYWPIAPTGIG